MAKEYSEFSKEQLIEYIEQLKSQLKSEKYGLYWDKSIEKEECVKQCENNMPYFKKDNEKMLFFGESNNLLIEGDNFHSLTVLNYILKDSVDLIYIDPPYNTGHEDFAYNDDYVDEEDGYKHSKWLSFMEKRLVLAKELLNENGLIFISIDDREQANLKLLCDSIFGEKKHLATIHWRKNRKPHNAGNTMSISCEYILVYFKRNSRKLVQEFAEMKSDSKGSYAIYPIIKADKKIRSYTFPKGIYCEGTFSEGRTKTAKNDKCNVDIIGTPVIVNNILQNDIVVAGRFCLTDENGKLTEAFLNDNIYFTKGGIPKEKRYRTEEDGKIDTNYWDVEKGKNEDGNEELVRIFNISQDNELFSYPKPVNLMKKILKCINQKDAKVLDFFAGSGTMGQAVMELNNEDEGNRKFILCTNNENNICSDITYPRIKTVITGIRPDGTKYSDGISSNLIYYKTDFIKASNNTDQAKYCLVEKVDELLCVVEDLFAQLERNCYSSHYSSYDKTKHMFIYSDYYNEIKFNEFKQRVINCVGNKIVYVYSSDNNVDATLFEGITDVEVKSIPSKIYEIYKQIVEDIKREG